MRNNWEEVRISSLPGNASLSQSQHVEDEKRLYDFGTDRPISAPPPSGMGFDILQGLEAYSSGTWGDETEYMLGTSSMTKSNIGNQFTYNHSPNKDSIGGSISRPKSAAPQLMNTNSSPNRTHLSLFQSQNEKDASESESTSLFGDFDIMKIGSRRSASTGVIGHGPKTSSSVMDSLGLTSHDVSSRKQHSLMDLIQENVPKTTPSNFKNIEQGSEAAGIDTTLDPVNSAHHVRGFSSQPDGMHGVRSDMYSSQVSNFSHHPTERMQHPQNQNYNNHASLQTMGARPMAGPHHRNVPRPHGHNPSIEQGQQNIYEQSPGVQYYNVHQRDGVPVHTQHQMHPQVIQANANTPHAMYVNPSFGGYQTLQYHQAPSPHYPHAMNPVMHSHDPNLNARMSHPQQFIAAIPIQGGMSVQMNAVASNGTFIYFHQPGGAPAPGHHQTITVVDANGRPATIAVSPPRIQNVGRKQAKNSTAIAGKGGEKTVRKSQRGNSGKKGDPSSSLDASRHSISSSTLSLLEEYRTSKERSWTASDVKGHIVEFCQDQNGSRFVQQRLELAKEAEKLLIISEVLPAVHRLRNDVFGNYVVQKLFEHGTDDMRSQLKKSLEGEVLGLSTQMYGCRVVQKAVEKVNDNDLIDLLSEFHATVLSCIHDQNGNHVIQKMIEVISSRSKTYQAEDKKKAIQFSKQLCFILDCVTENIVPLSCHPFGCRVLQRILEHCIESQKSSTLDCIQRCLRILLDDQYGNYVIQHVLQFGRKSDRDIVLGMITENGILGLSKQKFASNVIEKLLKYGNGSHRNAIVREMLKVVDDKTVENGQCTIVLLMVRDAYANYVVQTTLDVVPEGEEKQLLLQELRSNSAQLRNYTFAKHIITKLEIG